MTRAAATTMGMEVMNTGLRMANMAITTNMGTGIITTIITMANPAVAATITAMNTCTKKRPPPPIR